MGEFAINVGKLKEHTISHSSMEESKVTINSKQHIRKCRLQLYFPCIFFRLAARLRICSPASRWCRIGTVSQHVTRAPVVWVIPSVCNCKCCDTGTCCLGHSLCVQ